MVLTALLLAFAVSAQAQETKVWRVGFMSPYSLEYDKTFRAGFERGMRELGYIQGKNLVIDLRHAEGAFEKFPQFTAELIERKADVLVVHGSISVIAAAKATRTIPIVFVAHPDPVGSGVVKSLARPGGNVTGLSDMHTALGAKRVELLKQIAPAASRIGILLDPTVGIYRRQLEELQRAAPNLHVSLVAFHMRGPGDIAAAFDAMKRERIDGLHILGGSAGIHLDKVIDQTRKHRLPTVATTRKAAEDGVLMSYGASFPELYRRAAGYVDKIFKGAKPADLPVDQPTTFELVVNMKTATAIGVKLPPALVQRADFVVQ